MVLYVLFIKAELEGVESISLDPDANLCFDVRNPASDFETREKIVIDPTALHQHEEGSKEPPYHFSITWEGMKKKSVLTILTESELKTALKKSKKMALELSDLGKLTGEHEGRFVPVLAMECRGIEPYAFHVMGEEFIITSAGGTVFSGPDVDLSQDFADYDEEHDISVSVTDFCCKVEAIK